MELFSYSFANTSFLFFASETGLFAHPVHNERLGHPLLLCSNYKNGFTGCIYNNLLHYAYINKDNALLVRRLHESGAVFCSDSTDTVTYSDPQLVVFKNALFLFYIEKEENSYRLKPRQLFPDAELTLPDSLRTSFPVPPRLFLSATEQYIYLILTVGATDYAYRCSGNTSFESLCTEDEVASKLRLPWEAEKKQLEQTILQAVHLSEQQQNLLTEKEQKLKHTSQLLERAKSQYNELMQVAEQYRQEARKWYGKFTDRN